MVKVERTILDFMRKNSVILFFVAISLIGIAVRYNFRDFVSGDAYLFLLPWYDEIKASGFSGLSQQIGDYNILYQFIIWLFTLLPLVPLHTYKILSVLFDYALAVIVALIADEGNKGVLNRLKSYRFVAAYSAILLCPLVFLDSACWAQCDSIYAFFIFASLYAYSKKKYNMMFILYGAAFAFKFQAVFVLPFIFLIYVVDRKFSILKLIYVPIILIISALPGILNGRSILDSFKIYFLQTDTYNAISLNYNSF